MRTYKLIVGGEMKHYLLMIVLISSCAISQWSQIGPYEMTVTSIAVSANGTMYAGTTINSGNYGAGVYKSTDSGESWKAVNTGLPVYSGNNGYVHSIACKNDTVYINYLDPNNAAQKIYRSVNGGTSWTQMTGIVAGYWGGAVADPPTHILITQNAVLSGVGNAVYRTINGGQTWTMVKSAGTKTFSAFFQAGNKIFVGGDSLYLSTDEGVTWTFQSKNTNALVWGNETTLFGKDIYNLSLNYFEKFARSTDDGKTWTDIIANLPSPNTMTPTNMFFNGSKIFLVHTDGFYGYNLLSSTNNGATWDSIPQMLNWIDRKILSSKVVGANIFMALHLNGIVKSTDNGVTWQTRSKGFPGNLGINQILQDGNTLYLAANRYSFYKSTDNGNSWNQYANGTGGANFQSMIMSGDTIFAGTNDKGFYRSINKGNSWSKISTVTNAPGNVQGLVRWNGKFYAGLSTPTTDRMKVSTDGGVTWTIANTGLTQNCICLKMLNNRLFYGSAGGLFMWTDTSKAWLQVSKDSIGNNRVNNVVAIGARLFAGTGANVGIASYVYYSDDNGIVWRKTKKAPYADAGILGVGPVSISAVGQNLFAVTGGLFVKNAVFNSTNGGDSWTDITGNIPATYTTALIKDVYQIGSEILLPLFDFSAYQYSIYRRTLSTLSVNKVNGEIPTHFTLSQNYPNPFNPSTKIEFQIPQAGMVRLNVYDALGREISTLVNEWLQPGSYTALFNASSFSSGTYFYQLRSGSTIETKRMMLIK